MSVEQSSNPVPGPVALSREAIFDSLVRDAQAATEKLVAVSELVATFKARRDDLVAVYKELEAAYAEAHANDLIRPKLIELGITDPAGLDVALRPAQKATRGRKQGRPRKAPRGRTATSAAPPSESELAVQEETTPELAGGTHEGIEEQR